MFDSIKNKIIRIHEKDSEVPDDRMDNIYSISIVLEDKIATYNAYNKISEMLNSDDLAAIKGYVNIFFDNVKNTVTIMIYKGFIKAGYLLFYCLNEKDVLTIQIMDDLKDFETELENKPHTQFPAKSVTACLSPN